MDFQPGAGRYSYRLIGLFLVLLTLAYGVKAQGAVITITPGQNIENIANAAPAGATIYVEAGLYRMTGRINPKDNQTFIAKGDVILNGSKLVTDWSFTGGYWVARNQTQQNPPKVVPGYEICESGAGRCNYRETLFFNDKPLKHEVALKDVGPGDWYFDYEGDAIYTLDNPTGVKVETSIAFAAFASAADNVTIDGFTAVKFATPLENATIEAYAGGHGWRIVNNTIRLNAAVGAVVRQNGHILNNILSDNGQAGYGAGADSSNTTAHGVVICGNVIQGNNWKRVQVNFSAGGGKVVRTTDAVICGNISQDNIGTGLWTDLNNVRTKYHGNTVTGNSERGIFHEWGGSGSIIGNILACNGGAGGHFGRANIVLTNVSDVQVMANHVTVCGRDNGIAVRADGGRDKPPDDIDICHNTIVYNGSGQSGGDAFLGAALGRMNWCDNTHISGGGAAQHWRINSASMGFSDWLKLYPSEHWESFAALTPTPSPTQPGGGQGETPQPIPPTLTVTAPAATETPAIWWRFELKGWPGGD